jgi:hypothetical protein
MSRGAEKEADMLGVHILYDAGYDPRAMAQFFEILTAKYGEGNAQFLSDHPNPGNRTEYVGQEVDTLQAKTNYIKTTPAFTSTKAQVAKMQGYTAKQVQSGVWKKGGDQQPPKPTADLNTSGDWRTVQGGGFTIEAPNTWQVYNGQNGGGTLAPTGGIVQQANGSPAVMYGMVTGIYRPQRQGMELSAALNGFVADIQHDNPGLAPGGQAVVQGNGVKGRSMLCNNPQANGGQGERDWIVMFPQADGNIRYFVFVAPVKTFDQMRPAFERMMKSVTIG